MRTAALLIASILFINSAHAGFLDNLMKQTQRSAGQDPATEEAGMARQTVRDVLSGRPVDYEAYRRHAEQSSGSRHSERSSPSTSSSRHRDTVKSWEERQPYENEPADRDFFD